MAPPTGPARTTRSSTRGGAGARRGGGPGRVDRDGDLVMDASIKTTKSGGGIGKRSANNDKNASSAKRGRPGLRSGPPGRSAIVAAQDKILRHINSNGSEVSTRPRRSHNTTILRVEGLKQSKASSNQDQGLRNILDFLERKAQNMCKRTVTVKKSHLDKNLVLHVLASKEDAEEIVKLNGWMFAGTTLAITESDQGWPGDSKTHSASQPSPETSELKEKFKAILSRRYDLERKLLDLSGLGQDPVLSEMAAFADKERAEKTFMALMTICDEVFSGAEQKREAIHSVSLANNSIDHVSRVFTLATTFPDLKHLDCSGNLFKDSRSLSRWRHYFKGLETLLLTGNPIETNEPNYKEDMMKWFPRLQLLSGTTVRTPEQIAAEEAAKAAMQPTPIPQGGADFRDAGNIGEQFLLQFLPMFDTDRAGLAAMFYDEKTSFSLSVVNQAPRDVDTPVPSWQPYLKYSRNLVKITHPGPRIQRLLKGRQLIQELWKNLPATKHPDLVSSTSKYLVDCHPLPALADPTSQSAQGVDGLIINIHGEFEEKDPNSDNIGQRSFSRTFVLGPGAPGGPQVRVVSDMLSLRAYNPIPLPQGTPTSNVVPENPELQKQQLVAELSRRTNMTLEYSEMCLTQVNWDLEAAMVKFRETTLGPEAFINGVPAVQA
ncbi:hypothetical protein PspLS_07567 [Pyricularia sp. CBS 133598]|nr:hypothetical protein PspLS_07567 [Pyricularia sp. CBS 133598]